MKSLDTNVLMRLLLADAPVQATQVKELLGRAKPRSFEVADAVFFEIVWILAGPMFRFDRPLIAEMLLQIIEIDQVVCNKALISRAVPLYVTHPKLSFIDVALSIYAELNGSKPLLTFDKALAAQLPTAKLLGQTARTV